MSRLRTHAKRRASFRRYLDRALYIGCSAVEAWDRWAAHARAMGALKSFDELMRERHDDDDEHVTCDDGGAA